MWHNFSPRFIFSGRKRCRAYNPGKYPMRSGSGHSRCCRSRSAIRGSATDASLGVGVSHWITGGCLQELCWYCGRESSGKRCRKNGSAVRVRFTPIFGRGEKAGVFLALRQAGLAETDDREGISWRWQSIEGAMGKKHPWPEKPSERTRRIGGKRKPASFAGGRPWNPAVPRRHRGQSP